MRSEKISNSTLGTSRTISSDPTVIVGMSCCFPEAETLAEFETLLLSGRSGLRELPVNSMDRDLYFDERPGQAGKTYSLLGGKLGDTEPISIPGLSSDVAARFDPVHRRFTQVALSAWHHAGLQPSQPGWTQAGVFVGHSGATALGAGLNFATQIEEQLDFLNDLERFQRLAPSVRRQVQDQIISVIRQRRPNRQSCRQPRFDAYQAAALPAQLLGLAGPRVVCDAACASSLYSLEQALLALQTGQIDAAIVGGATPNGIDNLILFSQSQACSATGSRPFDQSADGLVCSEGYAAVVVTRLSLALRHRLFIWGIIDGLGTSCDGRGKSLWAPRTEGQQLAMRRAYRDRQPLQVEYVEAHATSTQLGDATELESIQALLAASGRKAPLLIGSVKSNLGHTLETAGIAGLIKVLLAMHRNRIPASLNFVEPNEKLEEACGRIRVVSTACDWPQTGGPKSAAVSAFGIGGLNAHLSISSAPESLHASTPAASPRGSVQEPIAIIGRGVVLPGSHNLQQFARLLKSGETRIGAPPADRWRTRQGVPIGVGSESHEIPTANGGYVRDYDFDSQRYRIPPNVARQANPLQMMLLDATTQATAGIPSAAWERHREKTGVVIGTLFRGVFGSQLQSGLRLPEIARELSRCLDQAEVSQPEIQEIIEGFRRRVLEARPALLDETGSFTASTLASRVAKTFDLMGGACAIDVDDASGLAALHHAIDQLRAGHWTFAVCGAAERALDLNTFSEHHFAGNLVTSGRPRDIPNDCRRILPGEGVAVVLLQPLREAMKDQHPILGIIDEVTLSHGPADPPLREDAELVRQIGYLAGAHGLVRLVKRTLTWQDKSNAERSTQICSRTEDDVIYRVTCRPPEHREGTVSQDANRSALPRSPRPTSKSSKEPAAVFEKNNRRSQEGTKLPLAFRISAVTSEGLLHEIRSAQAHPEQAFSRRQQRFESSHDYRLWLLAENPIELSERLASLQRLWERGRRAGVFETERALLWRVDGREPRTAWLFPGQGTQYKETTAAIAPGSPAMQRLAEIDRELQLLGKEAITPHLFAGHTWGDIWWNQVWVLAMGLGLTAELNARGWRPDLVIGHSFGEYPALVAAGVLSLKQVVRMVKARAEAVSLTVRDPGQLISVRAAPSEVHAAIQAQSLPAVITHQNGPRQTVIATDTQDSERVRKALQSENLASLVVPVPVAYHSPRLEQAGRLLESTFAHEHFSPPRCGVLSVTNARYTAEPAELRNLLVAQLTHPVLFAPAVERLLTDGFQVLLEVGPNQILSRLCHEIAGERALCLSLDLPGRSHAERLLMLQGALEIVARESTAPILTQPTEVADPHDVPPPRTLPIDEIEVIDVRQRRAANAPPKLRVPSSEVTTRGATRHATAHTSFGGSPGPQEVQRFLTDVFADLTGYSREVIDFDADLEADLGVDSIKQAQLVGELIQYCDIDPSAVTLQRGKLRTLNDIAALATVGDVARPVERVAETRVIPRGSVTASDRLALPDRSSLERFLVDLVVVQTGYARDVVDLDADMEAELGIDSIKQAQLLGEVQQQFELSEFSAENGRTMRFPTLRSIMEYLERVLPHENPAAFRAVVSEESSLQEQVSRFVPEPPRRRLGTFPSDSSSVQAPQTGTNRVAPPIVRGVDPIDELDDRWFSLLAPGPHHSHKEAQERGLERGERHRDEIRAGLRLLVEKQHSPGSVVVDETDIEPELSGIAMGAGVALSSLAYARQLANQRTPAPISASPVSSPQKQFRGQTCRYALRMLPAPRREGMPTMPAFSGPALILGENALSEEICRRFSAAGLHAVPFPRCSSLEEVEATFENLWQESPLPHLFITTSHDAASLRVLDPERWKLRRFEALEVPYRICQLWMQRMIDSGRMDDGSVVLATNLGGDFGLSGRNGTSPEGGLSGLIKAMLIESWMRGFRATPMKIVDVGPQTTPQQAIEQIWRELAVPSYDMEVAFEGDHRQVLQAVPKPLPEHQPKLAGQPAPITRGGTWVITGGARGITAHVAEELGRRYGLQLHLIGTTPEPQLAQKFREAAQRDRLALRRRVMAQAAQRNENGVEAWRNVEKAIEIDATLTRCREAGIAAWYHCCDVSSEGDLQETLEAIRQISGPIEGILHGAGVGQDARFDRKRPDKVDQCFRAKIDGCLNLMAATLQDPLEWFLTFGSISGRFGANGHTDYSCANDTMAKLVDRFRQARPEVRSVCFHWHAWGDIGMATKPETKLALELINLEFMPAAEGLAHFFRELESGGDEPEVLITDRAYYRKFFPVDRTASATSKFVLPMLDPEGDRPRTPPGDAFSVQLDPQREQFLRQHLIQQKPTLPFVVALELMAEAARGVSGAECVIEAHDVEAIQAIKWNTSDPMTVRIRTQPASEMIQCALTADVVRRDGRVVARDRTYFKGTFQTSDAMPQQRAAHPDLSELTWEPIPYPEAPGEIFHGPDLQCLRKIAISGDRAYGEISASSTVQLGGGNRPVSGWSVHCAALDACLYAAAMFAGKRFSRASLPSKFGVIRFRRLPDPGEPCLVSIALKSELPGGLLLTFDMMGQNGDLLLYGDDYAVTWLT